MIRAIAGLLIAAVSAVAIAQAPANPPVRIRGMVEKMDGQNMIVKARDGALIALEVHNFAESMRGFGEGHALQVG